MFESVVKIGGAITVAFSLAGCAGPSAIGSAIQKIKTSDCIEGNGLDTPVGGLILSGPSQKCADDKTANIMIMSPSRELNGIGLLMKDRSSPTVHAAIQHARLMGDRAPMVIEKKETCKPVVTSVSDTGLTYACN